MRGRGRHYQAFVDPDVTGDDVDGVVGRMNVGRGNYVSSRWMSVT